VFLILKATARSFQYSYTGKTTQECMLLEHVPLFVHRPYSFVGYHSAVGQMFLVFAGDLIFSLNLCPTLKQNHCRLYNTAPINNI